MTMASNNPAFGRGFQTAPRSGQFGGGLGAPTSAPTQYDPYNAPSPYGRAATRYMTMDDVVTKTGITFLVTVLAAAGIWALPGQVGWGFALPAVLVGLVRGLVIFFKMIANPAATLAYAAVEGVFLGAIGEAFDDVYPGIVLQAIIGTLGVFSGMLVVYKTGAIRVTTWRPRRVIGRLI